MKSLALCLFIACLPGCGKATEREPVDSEQTREECRRNRAIHFKDPSPHPLDSDQANRPIPNRTFVISKKDG